MIKTEICLHLPGGITTKHLLTTKKGILLPFLCLEDGKQVWAEDYGGYPSGEGKETVISVIIMSL